MNLEIEFNNDWVEYSDIQHLEHIIGEKVHTYFKRKRDFNCFSYQGGLVHCFTLSDIEYLVNYYYYNVEISCDTIKILN